jgi:DNA repair protein RAD16
MIPTSEDDVTSISTSLKNVSKTESLRRGGPSLPRSRSTRVILDSEDEGDDGFGGSDPVSRIRTRSRASGTLEVVIPAMKDESATDSSRSSLGITSADGTTGFNTPATSVGAAAESDSKQSRKRVNASERAARLQQNTVTRRTSLRGTKRSAAAMSVDDIDQEATDAALARALQMEEYGKPNSKKQRTGFEDVHDSARSLAERLDAMPPDAETSESELSDRITPVDSEEEMAFKPTASDSEDEFFPATEERVRQAFPPESQADEDEDLPTWEEQRKLRRVSLQS